MIHDFNEADVSGVAFLWNWLRKIVFLLGMVCCIVGAFTSFSAPEERTLIPILVNIAVILVSLGSAALVIMKKPRIYRSLLLGMLAACAGLLYWKDAMASFIFQVTGIAFAWIGHMGILGIFSIVGAILAFVFRIGSSSSSGSSNSSGSESASERKTSESSSKKYYCEYCGQDYPSVFMLTHGKCSNHPDGRDAGYHKLYEGGEKSKYTCKYCGDQFDSIWRMTHIECSQHPNRDRRVSGYQHLYHAPAL